MKIINNLNRLILVLILLTSNITAAQDPGDVGPYHVASTEYNLGDTAFTPTNFPKAVELRASVHYPSDLTQGNLPLVIFIHGNYSTCTELDIADNGNDSEDFNFRLSANWPCNAKEQAIPNYKGYDYLGRALASHGYIVASISANGIRSVTSINGINARAQLIQRHLELWQEFNTNSSSALGNLFIGKVNINNIGTMGHSRGGEAVVEQYNLNKELGSPYAIKAVLPLAATNGNRYQINDVALGTIIPYCDGDTIFLPGVHYYDDARYSSNTDNSPKHTFLMMGANHHFFNTTWSPQNFDGGGGEVQDGYPYGGFDEAPQNELCKSTSSERLSSSQQRKAATTYVTAFFRTYLGNEEAFEALLNGDSPAPSSTQNITVHASYHPPKSERLDINRLDGLSNETINSLGGSVSQSNLSVYRICGGEELSEQHCLINEENYNQPHTAKSLSGLSNAAGLSQLLLSWSGRNGLYENSIPLANRNFSNYEYLQFRAGVNYTDSPLGLEQDFNVYLTDINGNESSVRVGSISDALFYPPGGRFAKLILNTIRIPLDLYNDVDMSNITKVQFRFDQTAKGSISVSDLILTGEPSSEQLLPLQANFENGLKWENTGGSDWIVNSGGTRSSSTGPSAAVEGSYYAYLETSRGDAFDENDTAQLLSPAFNNTNIQLDFNYHMYGSDIGSLHVDVFDGTRWIESAWSISGAQHNSSIAAWNTVSETFNNVSQIRIRAIAAGGYRGDIAIDNLIIIESSLIAPTITRASFNNERARIRWNDEVSAGYYEVRLDGGSWRKTTASDISITLTVPSGPYLLELRSCNTTSCSAITSEEVYHYRDAPFGIPRINEGSESGDGESSFDGSDDDFYTITYNSIKFANRYEVQLNKSGWRSVGNLLTATFQNLKEEENKLEVRACNESGCYESYILYVTYTIYD